jgi:hypothetical protein
MPQAQTSWGWSMAAATVRNCCRNGDLASIVMKMRRSTRCWMVAFVNQWPARGVAVVVLSVVSAKDGGLFEQL